MTKRPHLFISIFATISLIVISFVSTSQAQPEFLCSDIFATPTAFIPIPIPSLIRKDLVKLGLRYQPLSAKDRAQFRDALYTKFSHEALQDVESELLAYRQKEPAFRNYVRHSIRLLKGKTDAETKNGELSAGWALKLPLHIASLQYVLQLQKDENRELRKHFEEAYGKSYLSKLMIRARISLEQDLRSPTSYIQSPIAAVPTRTKLSAESILILMAHGTRVYELPRNSMSQKIFYQHDMEHAEDWLEAIYKAVESLDTNYRWTHHYIRRFSYPDIINSAVYQRIHDRLQMISARLQQRPDYQRRAGFAVLLYMFHDAPGIYVPQLARQEPMTEETLHLVNTYPDQSLSEFRRPDRLGFGFPTVPISNGRNKKMVVQDPETIIQLGITEIQKAAAGL